MSRQLFDEVAATYDAYRPDYPGQLFDVLESALGQPLLRADVVDVGAGTGIATRALAGRGCTVVAIDPGPGVLAVLRSRSTSRVRPVVGDGNALPLRSGVFDLVTYAQSFHWTDPERSVAEAARVLHDRGVLAVFWNLLMVDGARWWERLADASERLCPSYDRRQRDADWGAPLDRSGLFRWVRRVEIPWIREVAVDGVVRDYSSHSYVAAMAEGDRARVLAELQADLQAEHPDGTARLPYVTRTWVARR
ncbi:MAG: class I SAM-dependent methyltransferase [Actinomycetes bacterium]